MTDRWFVAAGEVSGDMHAADLIRAVRERSPSSEFIGLGGPKMMAAGISAIDDDVSHLNTVGLLEGISALRKGSDMLRRAKLALTEGKYRAAILTDNQGLNVLIAKEAKKLGIPVIYYSPPHVSIWGAWDAPKLAEGIDLLVPHLPADAEVYRKAGGNVLFEGHPLVDRVTSYRLPVGARDSLGLPDGKPLVGIFPGSRRQEIRALLPVFLDTAKILAAEADAVFVFPVSHPVFEMAIRDGIREAGLEGRATVTSGDPYAAMVLSDVLVMSSGTATLEAALFRKPLTLAYRISGLTFFIMKFFVKKKMIGLPNILLDRVRFPELLQKDCNPRRIADETLRWLRLDSAAKSELAADFDAIAAITGKPGVIGRVADAILARF
jgi:lipid-A-disaccharide synthase